MIHERAQSDFFSPRASRACSCIALEPANPPVVQATYSVKKSKGYLHHMETPYVIVLIYKKKYYPEK